MNVLVIALFLSVFLCGYLGQHLRVISTYWVLVPEALSMVALLIVIARVIGGRRIELDWRYGAFFGLFFFILLFGFLAQSVPAGPVVAGLRNYVKFIPFFLLPAVYPFSSRQLKTQFVVVLVILLLQSPLAVFQRFVQFADRMHTGDPIRGMTTSSSSLTLLMMCMIALLVALYLRRRIRFPLLLIATAIFLLPTTLNETKSTFLMLPVAVLFPVFFMPRRSRSSARMVPLVAVGAFALIAYISVYNYLIQYRHNGEQIDSFFASGAVENYLYTGAARDDGTWIGRFDSVALAVRVLANEPLSFAFGLGAGNVSHSQLPGFDGQYSSYVERYGMDVTQVSSFLWEIGLVGLAAYLLLYWFVFQDSRLLARTDGPFAIYGQAWSTVIVIMTASLMYKSVMSMNEIAYLFWFYSGVVAREAYVERRRSRAAIARRQGEGEWKHMGAGARVPQLN